MKARDARVNSLVPVTARQEDAGALLGLWTARSIWWPYLLQPLIYSAILLGIWQGVVSFFSVPSYLIPSPVSVLRSLLRLRNYYVYNASVTIMEAGLGALIGFSAGFLSGTALRYGGRIGRALSPIMLASQVFPKEALAPLFLVFLGFGPLPKIVISALICFFPVAINTLKGLQATPNAYERLMLVLGATAWQRFRRCHLPFAAPYLFASLRVCTTLSIIGAVVGEFVGSTSGLGYVIRSANADIGTDRIYAALLLLGVIGISFYAFSLLVEQKLFRQYAEGGSLVL